MLLNPELKARTHVSLMVHVRLHPAVVGQLCLECGVGQWLWLQVEHSLVGWDLEEGQGGEGGRRGRTGNRGGGREEGI